MASVSIEIRGYNRVSNNLRRLASDLEKELDPVGYKWAQETRATLKGTAYPPKPPRSKYVRTGRLGSSWGVQKQGYSKYAINNSAPYSSFVVGDARGEGQAYMHVGRWWLARPVMNNHTGELTKAMTKAINDIWESGSDRD